MRPRWDQGPSELWLVRHGESVGNQADERARAAGAEELELEHRDADVPLSERGRHQASALGDWIARRPHDQRPTLVLTSPYQRAAATADLALRGVDAELLVDERLRERDLGLLDGLTGHGIRSRHPAEAERRGRIGKFYYAPPSGESWADVALRIRSLLNDLRVGHDGERVWMFTHQAVIMTFRYVLEGLSEQQILDLDAEVDIGNVSVTRFQRDGAFFETRAFAEPVIDAELLTTEEPAGRQHG